MGRVSPTASVLLHHWGRSSAGRAPDWQSGGSWVQVPSPPPKFLMRASGFRRKFRRTIRPREIPARHPTRWPSHCTLSSRLPCDIHRVRNATQIAGVQVGVRTKEDRRIVAQCGSGGGDRNTLLGHEARRRVTKHVGRGPRRQVELECCRFPDLMTPVRHANSSPCRRGEHRRLGIGPHVRLEMFPQLF
jgi:hypothetical protein